MMRAAGVGGPAAENGSEASEMRSSSNLTSGLGQYSSVRSQRVMGLEESTIKGHRTLEPSIRGADDDLKGRDNMNLQNYDFERRGSFDVK